MLNEATLQMLRQLAHGLCVHFGSNCEVVVHDLSRNQPDSSIVLIENGHVSSRKVGDGPSHIVLEALRADPAVLEDKLSYLTRTHDGRILKSSTIYIRDEEGGVAAIFAINYDITGLLAVEGSLHSLISTGGGDQNDSEHTAERQRSPGRAHQPVHQARGQACGHDEQGRQDKSHPVPQQRRSLPHHQERRQGQQAVRHKQIHTI